MQSENTIKLNKIENASQHRRMCWRCRQPESACYCHLVQAFDSGCDFVILIHPKESRKRIATGRMAHRLLQHSYLFEGEAFNDHPGIRRLLEDSHRDFFVLYPSSDAIDLDCALPSELGNFSNSSRRPTVFLIDGTWATARRTMRLSSQLNNLQRLKFKPKHRSRFEGVRKQPEPNCVSTIEAIHELLERLNERIPERRAHAINRPHDHLIDVFVDMVQRQATFNPASPLA